MASQTPRPRHKRTSRHGTQTRSSPPPSRPTGKKPERRNLGSIGSTHPKTIYDRYIALAKAAVASGNAVESEHYYQHADHYFRLMNKKPA